MPQLNVILERLPEQIEIRVGVPGLFGGGGGAGQGEGGENGSENNSNGGGQEGKPPKLSEIAAFCGAFNGSK